MAARRAGVAPDELVRLTELGILQPTQEGRYTAADVRRVEVARAFERAGLDLRAVAQLVRSGALSLAFLDDAGFGVFAALSDVTFAALSEQTGIPVERLLVLREVAGDRAASPQDRVRENELEIVPLVQYQLELGFAWPAIERGLRVYADSLRRIAEGEAEWWRSEVQQPMLAGENAALSLAERAREISPRLSLESDRALKAIYHAQQRHVWLVNIVDGIATGLEQAGAHERQVQVPALCFLDVSGYTQLTNERGDAAAAELAERLNRIVQRVAVEHGGRAIKWLGDGVMFHFPVPRDGVVAALTMIQQLAGAGLPPAHVGLHAGPVVVQQGDYYGQTVNLASRIGDYARPGEVLVSRALVDEAGNEGLDFAPIGPVMLKGISSPVDLYSARFATPSKA